MIETSRRTLIKGLAALVAAPAIVRVQSIMPVRSMLPELQLPVGGYISAWPSGVALSAGDVVQYEGRHYVCMVPGVTSDSPTHYVCTRDTLLSGSAVLSWGPNDG